MIVAELDSRRFDALASYARHPAVRGISRELAWYASPDERVLGVLLHDLVDNDYTWLVMGRDEALCYRACDLKSSFETRKEAYSSLMDAMARHSKEPDNAFHQGDVVGPPIDFFVPVIGEEKQHQSFRQLAANVRYSPARGIIEAMMRSYEDVDGNFINQFQAGGFDARIWELYLSATFNELDFIRNEKLQVPDFVLVSPRGPLAVEATTANPSPTSPLKADASEAEMRSYLENYIAIKLSRALRPKLNRKPPYWEIPELIEMPFCIAVQDFHAPGSMRHIVPFATEYAFGVRHEVVDGKTVIKRLKKHRYKTTTVQPGFFFLEGAENVSALILNPAGTLSKFNRIGAMTGFGDSTLKIIRQGLLRRDGDPIDPTPKPFHQEVGPGYDESWVEGMVVLHNPRALRPLNPDLLPGANHEFLQDDGKIMSLLPDFHPWISSTFVTTLEDVSEQGPQAMSDDD